MVWDLIRQSPCIFPFRTQRAANTVPPKYRFENLNSFAILMNIAVFNVCSGHALCFIFALPLVDAHRSPYLQYWVICTSF
jgi:hypothetical protein